MKNIHLNEQDSLDQLSGIINYHRYPILIFCLGTGLSILGFVLTINFSIYNLSQSFSAFSTAQYLQIQHRLDTFARNMRIVNTGLAQTSEVSKAKLNEIVQPLFERKEYSGFLWIPHSEDGNFEIAFTVFPDNVTYPEKMALVNYPEIANTLFIAQRNREMVASQIVKLLQEKKVASDLAITSPVFSGGLLRGYVIGILELQAAFESAPQLQGDTKDTELYIYDANRSGNNLLFNNTMANKKRHSRDSSNYKNVTSTSPFHYEKTINFPGLSWRLVFVPSNLYLSRTVGNMLPWTVLVFGLLLTCSISLYLFTVVGRNIEIRRQVTEQTQSLRVLNQSFSANEGKIRAILDNSVDGIITISEQGMIESYNRACERIFGYQPEEVLGKNIKMLMPEPYHSEHDQYLLNYKTTGKAKIIGIGREVEGLRKNGKKFPVELAVSQVQLEDRKIYSGIVRDITERKTTDYQLKQTNEILLKLTKSLSESEEQIRAIVENTADGIVTISERGSIESYNKACEKIFGYTEDEVIGKNVKILMPEPYYSEHDSYLENYKRTGVAKIMGSGREVEGKRKDGSQFPVDLAISQVKLGDRTIYSGIIRDITDRKKAEERLKKTAEALVRSNSELEQFAYIASHDLKAPLRAIDQLSHWIIEDLGDLLHGDSKENMDTLRSRVKRMQGLLDDLLLYSRAGQSKKIDKNPIVSGRTLVEETLALLNPPEGFSITIDTYLDAIQLQKIPLHQVMLNLVSNALKHRDTEFGKIEISARDKGSMYEFSVRDDGPGIPAEFHEKVFEMFQTLSPRDRVEGSGMGLALVKKIITHQGGEIHLESVIGEGATFRFTWPKNLNEERIQNAG